MAVCSPDASFSFSTATSWSSSYPATLAVYVFPLPTSTTEIEVAPSTTWWFVRTSPSEVSTIPVPAAFAPSYPSTVFTFTSPGETFAATAAGSNWCCESCEPLPAR